MKLLESQQDVVVVVVVVLQWRHCRCWKWWVWLVKALDAESVPAFLCPSICQCYSPFNILYMLFLLSLFYWAVCVVWCLLLYCFYCLYLHFLCPFYMPNNSFSTYCTKTCDFCCTFANCDAGHTQKKAKKHVQGLIVGKRQFWGGKFWLIFFLKNIDAVFLVKLKQNSSQTETKKYFVL